MHNKAVAQQYVSEIGAILPGDAQNQGRSRIAMHRRPRCPAAGADNLVMLTDLKSTLHPAKPGCVRSLASASEPPCERQKEDQPCRRIGEKIGDCTQKSGQKSPS